MFCGESRYIWQAEDWPNWRYDLATLASPMAEVARLQGVLLGRLADVGLALRDQASLAALTEDVISLKLAGFLQLEPTALVAGPP